MSEDVAQIDTSNGVLAGQGIKCCPFCGERRKFSAMLAWILAVDEDSGAETEESSISCNTCGTYGPPSPEGLFGAIRLWNQRGGLA
jgi:hypothetical protein